MREVHHRIKNNLQGVAGLIQQAAVTRPEVAAALEEAAAQIQAIAQVHGLQIRSTGTLPVLGVAQGIFQNLASMFGVEVGFELPPPRICGASGLPESEAVPLALVINDSAPTRSSIARAAASRSSCASTRVRTGWSLRLKPRPIEA